MSIRNKLFSNLIPRVALFQGTRLIIYKRNFLNAKKDQRLLYFIIYVTPMKKENIQRQMKWDCNLLIAGTVYEKHAVTLAMWRDLVNVSTH